jgi:RNA polymerase sigma factor (sigma-70 family)
MVTMAARAEVEVEVGLDVGALYADHAGRVRQFVGASVRAPEPVIEDACQFAWSRLVLHRARIARETAPAWLAKTAVHEAFKLIRRQAREVSLEALLDQSAAARADPVTGTVSLDDVVQRRAKLDSIGGLPERQQRLVWLQAFGLSYEEISAYTEDTPRTVERQLLRAKHRLASLED